MLQFGAIGHKDCRTRHSAEPGMGLRAGLVGIEDRCSFGGGSESPQRNEFLGS